MYSWHAEDRLFVNRRYQRKLVWTLEEKQRLIESILRQYPIPAVLIAEREGDKSLFEIIDGLQRLNAIISYIEGAFPTPDGKYFDVARFPTAQARFEQGIFLPYAQDPLIEQKDVSTLLDYSLAVSIMRRASDREVDEVFDRINSYGHRLSDQERRQAGLQNDFSDMVRDLACTLRGDESEPVMPLSKMPAISIDLPMTRHGYSVRADDVFWVHHGILRSTDLRDSMDEQCIADIGASIIFGSIIERSKDALDELYDADSESARRLLTALNVYGKDRFIEEFKFCLDQMSQVCSEGVEEKLRTLIFPRRNTNAFPAVFSVIFIAFHELFIKEGKRIVSFAGVKRAMNNLTERIETSRRATSPEERRKNVDTIKGLIAPHFVVGDMSSEIYSNHSSADIDASIRRSEIELSHYEMKQGIVSLSKERRINEHLLTRILETICAIANNGPGRAGKLLIGVADKEPDVKRIIELDGVTPRNVGSRSVVGVKREANALSISLEEYHRIIRDSIINSGLSDALKSAVLSNIDFNSYFGLGVIVISVPAQREPSFLSGNMFWRDGDQTKLADSGKLISDLSRRF